MKWSMHKITVVDISDSFQNTHIYNFKVANKFLTVSSHYIGAPATRPTKSSETIDYQP